MELSWLNLVAETVREFGKDPADELDLGERLRTRDGYKLAHREHACGADDRTVRRLLRRELAEITGKTDCSTV